MDNAMGNDDVRVVISEQQRIALGFKPTTVAGWLFWMRYWSPLARWASQDMTRLTAADLIAEIKRLRAHVAHLEQALVIERTRAAEQVAGLRQQLEFSNALLVEAKRQLWDRP